MTKVNFPNRRSTTMPRSSHARWLMAIAAGIVCCALLAVSHGADQVDSGWSIGVPSPFATGAKILRLAPAIHPAQRARSNAAPAVAESALPPRSLSLKAKIAAAAKSASPPRPEGLAQDRRDGRSIYRECRRPPTIYRRRSRSQLALLTIRTTTSSSAIAVVTKPARRA